MFRGLILNYLYTVSLKVERQDYHVAAATIDIIRVLHQRIVNEVAPVLVDDIQQAKAELYLRDKLEERQVKVAPKADLQIEVERLEPQGIMLADSKVDHGIDAGNEIGAEVVVSRSGKLHVDRHRDVGALEHLRTVRTASLLVIDRVLLPEVDAGQQTQREILVQAKVAKHTNRKPGAVVVNLSIPLLARLGVDEPIVLQLDVLHVKAKKEAIVKLPLVDVRAVLHLRLLRCQAQGKGKDCKRDEISQNVCAHHHNNDCKQRFIAQITLFSYKGEKKSDFCASLSLKLAIFAVRKLKSKSK